MFKSHATAGDVSATLANLPTEHLVFMLDAAWMVVGPTGVFVLVVEESTAEPAAHAVAQAEALRERLADQISWVPFIDAMVVIADREAARVEAGPCPSVPLRRLLTTIVDAPRRVDDETLAGLARIGLRRNV